MNEFDHIELFFNERFKLFRMRFKKDVTESFLEPDLHLFLTLKFVEAKYPFADSLPCDSFDTRYSLTKRYRRYCLHRWNKFKDGRLFPIILSVITSVVTALITTMWTMLRLQ